MILHKHTPKLGFVVYKPCAEPCGYCRGIYLLTPGKRYTVSDQSASYDPEAHGWVKIRDDKGTIKIYNAKHFESDGATPRKIWVNPVTFDPKRMPDVKFLVSEIPVTGWIPFQEVT